MAVTDPTVVQDVIVPFTHDTVIVTLKPLAPHHVFIVQIYPG